MMFVCKSRRRCRSRSPPPPSAPSSLRPSSRRSRRPRRARRRSAMGLAQLGALTTLGPTRVGFRSTGTPVAPAPLPVRSLLAPSAYGGRPYLAPPRLPGGASATVPPAGPPASPAQLSGSSILNAAVAAGEISQSQLEAIKKLWGEPFMPPATAAPQRERSRSRDAPARAAAPTSSADATAGPLAEADTGHAGVMEGETTPPGRRRRDRWTQQAAPPRGTDAQGQPAPPALQASGAQPGPTAVQQALDTLMAACRALPGGNAAAMALQQVVSAPLLGGPVQDHSATRSPLPGAIAPGELLGPPPPTTRTAWGGRGNRGPRGPPGLMPLLPWNPAAGERQCPRCGVYESFADATDECCLAMYGHRCRSFERPAP